MSDFVEAVVTMLPEEAGGRRTVVWPRDGSYRPFARFLAGGPLLRVRFLEGPATLAPGDTDRVVIELETGEGHHEFLVTGAELEIFEMDSRAVGRVTVWRLWRGALAV